MGVPAVRPTTTDKSRVLQRMPEFEEFILERIAESDPNTPAPPRRRGRPPGSSSTPAVQQEGLCVVCKKPLAAQSPPEPPKPRPPKREPASPAVCPPASPPSDAPSPSEPPATTSDPKPSSTSGAVRRSVPEKVPLPDIWPTSNITPTPKQARSTTAYVGDRSSASAEADRDGFAKIGPWIADDLLGTHQGDRRYLPAGREAPPSRSQRHWVPGYIGVRTTFDCEGGDNSRSSAIPWTPSYSGTYDIMLWDMQKATLVLAGTRDTIEEAAQAYDQFSIAYNGSRFANTNYKMTPAVREVPADRVHIMCLPRARPALMVRPLCACRMPCV